MNKESCNECEVMAAYTQDAPKCVKHTFLDLLDEKVKMLEHLPGYNKESFDKLLTKLRQNVADADPQLVFLWLGTLSTCVAPHQLAFTLHVWRYIWERQYASKQDKTTL